jgi:hypothetical protein
VDDLDRLQPRKEKVLSDVCGVFCPVSPLVRQFEPDSTKGDFRGEKRIPVYK